MAAPQAVQDRIKANKAEFVRIYTESTWNVTDVCEKVGISRETFYEWRRTDPAFRYILEQKQSHLNEEVEDILLKKIFVEEDAASVRFYLSHRHPDYKPNAKVVQAPNNVTFEDILDRSAARRLSALS